jgi:hypothetical protein
VNSTGSPAATLAEAGALPKGLTWKDNGNGTATLSGTPSAGAGGIYKLTFTATNSSGIVTQSFTLTVDQAPAVTSAASAKATYGKAFSFTFTSTGYPTSTVSDTGSVSGLTFASESNGTATLTGTPKTAGTDKLTISAKNSVGTATQSFTLTVDQAPAITSATSSKATHGKAFSFTFTSTGYPTSTVSHTGSVSGLTFASKTNGTATLKGTPKTAGTYTLTITAKNSVKTVTQSFKLTVS